MAATRQPEQSSASPPARSRRRISPTGWGTESTTDNSPDVAPTRRTSGEHPTVPRADRGFHALRAEPHGHRPSRYSGAPGGTRRHSYTESAMPIYEYRCENGHT